MCVRALAVVVLWCLAASTGIADEAVATDVRVESVALFKNGLGFFRAGAEIPRGRTAVELGSLPVPSYGTFWVGYPQELDVVQIVTSPNVNDERLPVSGLAELLRLNAGERVTLHPRSAAAEPLVGVLIDVDPPPTNQEQNPYFMSSAPARGHGLQVVGNMSPSVVILRTADGVVSVAADDIIRVDLPDDAVVERTASRRGPPSLRIELERSAGNAPLTLDWLAKGITWVPSYRVDLSQSDTALVSARALIVNEVMDLESVHLDLVTGFPNIKFGEVRSPVAMQEPLADFLKALGGGRTASAHSGVRGNVMTQRAILVNDPTLGGRRMPSPDYSAAETGTVSEDLFLYPIEDFTLKRGETAYRPMFTAEVPYEHVYIWRIEDYLDENNRYRRPQRNSEEDEPWAEEIWHSCRVQNTLDLPLTTAAAEFVKDGQFVGQDIWYYTPPGARSTIRINRAMNVLAEQVEFEIERERNARRIHGSSYDRVRVNGELRLRSRVDKPIRVEVTKDLSGEVEVMEPPAKDIPTARGLRQVNPTHRLVWDVTVGAGEGITLTYAYQVYVRN